MPLKCPQFSSLSGYFFSIDSLFFWTHPLTSVPTCPAQYCDSYGVMNGRLLFWGTDRPWSVASDFREEAWLATLGFRRNTSAWLPWSLTVAVPAALPPPHGPSVSSPAQPTRSLFSPLPRRSPFIFMFFLHAGDVHGLQYVSQKPLWI